MARLRSLPRFRDYKVSETVKSGEMNTKVKWIVEDRDLVDGEMDWFAKRKEERLLVEAEALSLVVGVSPVG